MSFWENGSHRKSVKPRIQWWNFNVKFTESILLWRDSEWHHRHSAAFAPWKWLGGSHSRPEYRSPPQIAAGIGYLATSCDILWHLVTSCDLSWQPVAVQGKIWRNPRELTFLYISVIGGSWNAAEFCLERLQNIANCWSLLTELHPSIPMAFLSSKILFTWNLKAKFMFKSQFWMVALLSSKFLRPGRMFHLNPTVHG